MKYCIGIDLGGTNIAVGVVDENYEIVARANMKTNAPRPAEEIADDMAKATQKAIDAAGLTIDDIEWVGIGSPGAVNNETGEIIFAGNLNFHDVNIKKLMEDRLHLTVYVENDANAAAFGECLAGAAKGVKYCVMVTLGTGVGGGIIIDGKIYSGYNHAAAEVGHMVIERNGVACSCGRKGCMEAYASVTGLIRMTKSAMLQDEKSKMWDLVHGDINEVSGRTSFDAMREGDASAQKVVDEYIEYLGNGISSFINILQPEYLVIGGGISKEGETLLAPLRRIVKRESFNVGGEAMRTKVVAAKLGNDAGIIGAAFLGKNAQ